jgi:hypothetical protein
MANLKFYALSLSAVRKDGQRFEIRHWPEGVVTDSETSARQLGMTVALARWPSAAGWSQHNVEPIEVTRQALQEALDNIDQSGDDPTEDTDLPM